MGLCQLGFRYRSERDSQDGRQFAVTVHGFAERAETAQIIGSVPKLVGDVGKNTLVIEGYEFAESRPGPTSVPSPPSPQV